MRKSLVALSLFAGFLFGCGHAQSSVPRPLGIIQSSRKHADFSPESAPKHYILLYTFRGGADGKDPKGGLIRDDAGNLYGTTFLGGSGTTCDGSPCGTLFKLDP